ncbi:hypothetical protein G6047_16385 [Flavobacterium sp. SE-s28]|uniref:Adenylosuccinate lyase n=1 Tax=Flavobacterium silvaticum TaxID=1852020 RepID=A0A972FQQ4_9FLAO|nr:hypothetical protein [Flavobacterium silvaticum]
MNLVYEIEHSTAHRPIRDRIANSVLADEALFPQLFFCALDTKSDFHFKACWIMELVLNQKISLIEPYLDEFCQSLPYFENDSALRSISKICLFICERHFGKNQTVFASKEQLQHISEACFDWLISDGKVAMKAYAMRALFLTGKDFDWIYPELGTILEKDFPHHSAAYKAAARELLKKLKR